MRALVWRFATRASGATSIEYCMIAMLVALTIVGALIQVGSRIGPMFTPLDAAMK